MSTTGSPIETRRRVAGLLALAGLALGGCASNRSWSQGCPGIYSGVRFSRETSREVPVDGKIFYAFDLPLSALVDTLALPLTAFARPKPPPGGWAVGCRWARR